MKQSKRTITLFLSIFTVVLFTGCDEVFECIFNIEPEIHDRPLEIGIVGERYYDIITAEISNEVNDNDYFYDFGIVGELPPGVFYDINRRSIELFGVPEEPGNYRFRVELSVESFDFDGFDGSPTCSDFVVRDFVIQVVD